MKITDDELLRQLGRAYLLMHRRIDRTMTMRGASLAQTKLLFYVERHDGRARAVDIAELFGQAPRTVTQALDALERDGLIFRTTDPDDRRVKRLGITDAGRRAIAATEPLRRDLVQHLFARFTDEDRLHMSDCLAKLIDRLGLPDAEA
ncbi:MAG: MarR family winged helix-turn-helix transcriptional regulator [Sphingobium sp.]